MNSWIYLFSQFSDEALLFELLIILIICCSYAVFWVLRKRRYGAIDSNLPSGPVKTYLNELITDAEKLRLQLFGLLPTAPGGTSHVSTSIDLVPSSSKLQLSELEAKLKDQNQSIQKLDQEKLKLEKELETAKAASSPSAGQSEDTSQLQTKLKDLEAKLAEYSIIEDDLADLKRLQQENIQLKASLAAKAPSSDPSNDNFAALEDAGEAAKPVDG